MERRMHGRGPCCASSIHEDAAYRVHDRLCGQQELPAPEQPDPLGHPAALSGLMNVQSGAIKAYEGPVSSCCQAPVTFTFTPGAAHQMPVDWPPDAESCCGDSTEELGFRVGELEELNEAADLVTAVGQHRSTAADGCGAAKAETQQHSNQDSLWQHRLCSCISGHSTGHLTSRDELIMGDDFECMDSDEASKLLDDANIYYPGGVDAALADMYAACSGEQRLSASAGPAFGASSAVIGHLLDSGNPAAPAAVGVGCYYQHQYQHQHGLTVASLGAVVQTPTPPPCYAPNIMLPCCQWSAFSNDPVGAVLAGREPAAKYLAPRGSCCSSGGLTDCLMNLGPG